VVLAGAVVAGFVALTALLSAACMWIAGANPSVVFQRLLSETLGTPYGIGQTLFKATPLVLTGLAVALPLHAGLFNIGAEGQLTAGAFAAACVGLAAGAWPGPVLVVACAVAAFVAGGAWAGIAGVLRSRFEAHEVISTIMLNFVALGITSYFVTTHLAEPETVHTAPIAASAWLARLSRFVPSLQGSAANTSLFVSLAAACFVWVFLWRTAAGFSVRAVGSGPRAAEAGGVSVGRSQLAAFVVGGGLAGLAGVNEVLGFRHYFTVGFSDGVGFMGIAVAMLGLQHPAGVVLAALLLGAVSHGGLVVGDLVPQEVVEILEGLVIVMVLVAGFVVRRVEIARRKRALSGANLQGSLDGMTRRRISRDRP